MNIGTLANPFVPWAELVRGLRDRFVAELGEERPFSPYAAEILGQLAAMVTRCEHMGVSLERLSENDEKAFDAFLRALERS